MTIWARRSLFRELFGDDWNILMRREKESVTFIMIPRGDVTMDVDSLEWSSIQDTLTGVGAETVEFFVKGGNTGFRVTVDRDRLPEDFDD